MASARLAHLLHHPWAVALRALDFAEAGDFPIHAVGGTLRDAWLGQAPADFDVSLPDRGQEVAERLAAGSASTGAARLVHLGREEFAAYRLVPIGPVAHPAVGDLDLWDRRGGSLHADLERRDLTIHALALDLRSGQVLDPFAGGTDLDARLLRDVTPASFAEDPQRVVRLARFSAQLGGFSVEAATFERAVAAADDLGRVAPERVRSELERWGRLPESSAGARVLAGFGPFAALRTALPALARLDGLVRTADLAASERQAARWALIARLCSEDLAQWTARQWWGRKAAESARRDADAAPIPQSAVDRREWLHRRGPEWRPAAAAQLALTDDPAPQVTLAELHRLARQPRLFEARGFLVGDDLLALGLPAGPRVGRLLAELRRLEIRGDLTDRADALALARRLVGAKLNPESSTSGS